MIPNAWQGFDFGLGEDIDMLRDTTRSFSDDKIAPRADEIDKGFVDPLARDPQSQAVVQAIVALGRALDLTLLAEGVETEEQRVLLRLAGCEEMQGYLFARPASREALDRLLIDTARSIRAAVA